MRRTASVTLATACLVAASIATAVPAAADHLVFANPAGCSAGAFTLDVPHNISTKRARDVSIVVQADGTVVATCTFRRLPKRAVHAVTEEPWVRPAPGTTDDLTGCVLTDYPGRPFAGLGDWYGGGTATFGRAGKVTTVCTYDPAYFDGAGA